MSVVRIKPREGETLSYLQLWDSGVVKTRLKSLTQAFMTHLEFEEKNKLRDAHFKKAIKAKKAPKPLSWKALSQGERHDRYFEKAEKLAEKVLEKERQNYVDFRANRDKASITELIKRLRFLVWTVNEKGKPEKLKMIVEREVRPTDQGGTRTLMYVGERFPDGERRLHQIYVMKNRLGELREYVPYYPKDVRKLYNEAVKISTLEYARKEPEKKK